MRKRIPGVNLVLKIGKKRLVRENALQKLFDLGFKLRFGLPLEDHFKFQAGIPFGFFLKSKFSLRQAIAQGETD